MNWITRRHSMRLLLGAPLFSSLPACAKAGQPEIAKTNKTWGIALCGLGKYSTHQLGPALKLTKNCKLTGIITGSPKKIPKWQSEYKIPDGNVYSYDTMAEMVNNPDIDIVYSVTPHGLHFRDTMAALNAGKHVIVEKPMAGTEEECRQMLALAKEKKLRIEVGYRLHWDPYHIHARELSRNKALGEITALTSELSYRNPNPTPGIWQLSKKLSIGGVLYGTGVYPIQAALYLLRENPISVTATAHKGNPKLFNEVELGYEWTLKFPSGREAKCAATWKRSGNHTKMTGKGGSFNIDPCFNYDGLAMTHDAKAISFPAMNQQTAQMDAQCLAIEQDRPSLAPGTMGLRDVIILEAIMKSADTGKTVTLPADLGFSAHS